MSEHLLAPYSASTGSAEIAAQRLVIAALEGGALNIGTMPGSVAGVKLAELVLAITAKLREGSLAQA